MTRKQIAKMNAGHDFPSYTTKELKSHLRNELTAEMRARIEAEIASREKKNWAKNMGQFSLEK